MDGAKNLSVVVPIRSATPMSLNIRRLARLLGQIPRELEVVVVDDGSAKAAARMTERVVGRFPGARYIYLPTRWKRFSLARARNAGLRHAARDVVLFHDVDFLAPSQKYRKIAKCAEDMELGCHRERFFCVPVAFLTREGSERFLRRFPAEPMECSRFDKKNEDVKFLVLGSSALVANREHLLSIGGYNESFSGHGAEDFELLHRLSTIYPAPEGRPPDYTLNTGSGWVEEYRGFRAYFALYGKECLQKDVCLVHLFHPPRKGFGYYRHSRNFRLLKKIMENDAHRLPDPRP